MDALESILNDNIKLKDICANAFMKLDADGSGAIDLSEVKDMLQRQADDMLIDQPTKDELDELSIFLDPNGDQQMDFIEFYALVLQFIGFQIQEMKDAK